MTNQFKINLNFLKYLILLCFALSLTTCEKEDDLAQKNTSQENTSLKVSYTSLEHLKTTNSRLLETVRKHRKTNANFREENASSSHFYINKNRVQIIEKDNYTTYTFFIYRDNATPNTIENYLYKLYTNGSYEQFLIKYNSSLQENGEKIYSQVFIERIEDSLIVERNDCGPVLVDTFDQYVCSSISCGGSGHSYSQYNDCECGTSEAPNCSKPSQECEIQTVFVWDNSCGGFSGSDSNDDTNPTDTNPGNSNTGGSNPNDTSDVPDNNTDDMHTIINQPTLQDDILNCLNSPFNIGGNDTTYIDPELFSQISMPKSDWLYIKNRLEASGCSEEAQEIIIQVLEIECNSNVNDNSWTNNLDDNEEPKWGQLANKQEILDELNNVDGLNTMSYEDQITALVNHFEYNLMYDRDDNNNGELIQINNLDPNAPNNYSNDNPNDFLPISKGVNRYVYSEVGGWIDFHHVFKIFEWATQNGPFAAITGGEMGELMQSVKDNESAYSYEDLPSNLLGVAMYVRFSQDLALGNITWYQAVETSLNEISCVEPELAPNFNYIPHIVNEHYPQNYTYSPLLGEQLEQYHKAKFCERPIEEQINIKEAHEKFPR